MAEEGSGTARAAGWAAVVALGFLGLGSAAASPSGLLLGAPRPAGIALLALGVAGVVALRPPGRVVAAWAGLAWLPLALLLGLPVPGLLAFSGPPLLIFVLALAVAAMAAAPPRGSERAFFPVVLALYMAVSARVQVQVGAEGDEPHYLMVTESLLRDHDLDLTTDYVAGRYGSFYRGDSLEPHYRVRGREGRIYSLHALGLSLLILPAYALGGYAAASLFMALLGALLARELRLLIRDRGGPDWAAWALALSPPLLHYAGLVFTEIPAALGVAWALRRLQGRDDSAGSLRSALLGCVLGFLPWLNVRYAPLALILAAWAISTRPTWRRAAALLAPLALSLGALAAYHQVLYGFADPRRVYGPRPELALRRAPEGLQGLLLDQEFGLLVYAPILFLAVPGWFALLRERRRDAVGMLLLVAVVLGTAASWPMWRGGFNPPGRFLVPVLPVLAVLLASAVRDGPGARTLLLAGWSLWLGLAGAAEPRLVHRDRDGTAPLLRAASGAVEWTRLLPGYVLQNADRHRLAWVWGSVLVLAAWPGRRRPLHARGMAAASLVLLASAAVAQALSDESAGGREAVHAVGRPCLRVPGWRTAGACTAEWGAKELGWGPAYEPHRHPDGAVLGSRLELPPGRFRLRVESRDDPGGSEPPSLEVEAEGGRLPTRRLERVGRGSDGLEGVFDVFPGESRTTLRLRGGSAFVVGSIRLGTQPPGLLPGPISAEGGADDGHTPQD
jgi:hypothetical protein